MQRLGENGEKVFFLNYHGIFQNREIQQNTEFGIDVFGKKKIFIS